MIRYLKLSLQFFVLGSEAGQSSGMDLLRIFLYSELQKGF